MTEGTTSTEAELARRNAVLGAISYAATRIVGGTDWREGIQELLARLGLATGVSRVSLFEVHKGPDGRLAESCRYDWAAPGLPTMTDDPRCQNIPLVDDNGAVDEWTLVREKGGVVQAKLSEVEGVNRQVFIEQGTLSFVSVPVLARAGYWGFLGFDDNNAERTWNELEIDVLRTAAALVAAAIDNTSAYAALRDRERELVEAQRIAHVGSWRLDFATNEVSWSEEGWRIFGLEDSDAWSHADNLRHIHPEDREQVRLVDIRAREEGLGFEIEYRIVRPDGDVRTLREWAEPVIDASGRAICLQGTVHDVTRLKATEARLRESEERYALAARGADVGLWDWDLAKGSAYFSPRLCDLLGLEEERLGASFDNLLAVFLAEDAANLRQTLAARFAGLLRRFEVEVRAERAGELRWFIVRGLIVYHDRRPVRLVGSLGDITERKRAQEEVARQREALFQREKMAAFGSLLAGVAHELNNPLSVVIGQLALLEETTNDPAVRKRAERIRSAADRCVRIVRTFLAMARQKEAERRPVSVNAVIRAVLAMLAYQLRGGDVRLVLALDDRLPDVWADADQMHQVVTNLVVNASQALASTEPPRIIRIVSRFDALTQSAEFSISDNGPGVPEALRARIFDPFFTTKPAGEGTGLGLSLCASIVRQHGGEISVGRSALGGAVFTVSLPLKAQSFTAQPESIARPAARAMHVLVVEDETDIAETLQEILEGAGHRVAFASDGEEGLMLALSSDFDAVVSDIRLPGMDGRELYRALLERRPSMAERMLFITGDALSPEVQSFLAETRVACVEKPFVPGDILAQLSRTPRRTLEPAAGEVG